MDPSNSSIINILTRIYGIDECVFYVYQKKYNFDFSKLSLKDIYIDTEWSRKFDSDLKIIEKRYKIEKLLKNINQK